jgi:poly(3-hydroxybutyrate) depolymerase
VAWRCGTYSRAGCAGLVVVLVALIGGVAGCGGSAGHVRTAASTPFGYDAGQRLGFVDRGRVNHDYPIAVDDVSYTSGRDRITAFLVRPPGGRRSLPAVVYLHGAGGDRNELVVPSTWLAARGAIALVITAPSTVTPEPSGLSGVPFLRWQVQIQTRDVVAVRRAVDLLVRRGTSIRSGSASWVGAPARTRVASSPAWSHACGPSC